MPLPARPRRSIARSWDAILGAIRAPAHRHARQPAREGSQHRSCERLSCVEPRWTYGVLKRDIGWSNGSGWVPYSLSTACEPDSTHFKNRAKDWPLLFGAGAHGDSTTNGSAYVASALPHSRTTPSGRPTLSPVTGVRRSLAPFEVSERLTPQAPRPSRRLLNYCVREE
jgi:hypothetical protein